MTEALQVIGGLAVLALVVLAISAAIFGVLDWRRNRWLKQWPDYNEWEALRDVVTERPWVSPEDRKAAERCYRKLRFKWKPR